MGSTGVIAATPGRSRDRDRGRPTASWLARPHRTHDLFFPNAISQVADRVGRANGKAWRPVFRPWLSATVRCEVLRLAPSLAPRGASWNGREAPAIGGVASLCAGTFRSRRHLG